MGTYVHCHDFHLFYTPLTIKVFENESIFEGEGMSLGKHFVPITADSSGGGRQKYNSELPPLKMYCIYLRYELRMSIMTDHAFRIRISKFCRRWGWRQRFRHALGAGN